MPDAPIPITPETRVADLLEAYPTLETVLISIAPAFAKLRNPILRRTVAKVATLEQAARIGGLEARDLVRRLRDAAGMSADDASALSGGSGLSEPAAPGGPSGAPSWVDTVVVAAAVDADAMLDRGEHPLGAVNRELARLEPGGVLVLDSSFVPAPLVDAMTRQGCDVVTVAHAGRHRTYIRKPTN